MRDASGQPGGKGFECQVCGRFITTALEGFWRDPRVGSPQRFCDPACRQAASPASSRRGVAEDTPRQRSGGRGRLTEPASASSEEVIFSTDRS